MGHNSSNHSDSPVRRRGSPHRRSPSYRERSPGRHKNSHKGSSPVKEKSPSRHRSSYRNHSLEREKRSGHTKSPKHASQHSPISCSPSPSPSPRTKRLRRAQAEKEVEKVKEREYERNHSRGSEKSTHKERAPAKERVSERERGLEREMGGDRKQRRSGRDDTDSKSSRGRHERSVSPSDRNHRSRHRSRSPASNSRARDEVTNSRGAEQRDDEDDSVTRMKAAEEALEAKQKQKPTFELSGKLAAETNRVRGVTLLFNEPPDARKPNIRWRLYVFKAGEVLNEPLYIHRQSCYLFGRERRVADIPTDHPSCSKQHAVIQFRQVEKEQPDGTLTKQVRPYVMDLGSTNKTFINDNPIEPQRYYELFEKDTVKFAESMFYCTRTLPSDRWPWLVTKICSRSCPNVFSISSSHSLSFKEAARTSILSKHWLNLWRATRNIEFDKSFFVNPEESDAIKVMKIRDFIDFVQQWNGNYCEPCIDKFAFTFFKPGQFVADIENFIAFAIAKNVKGLILDFSDPTWTKDDPENHRRASFQMSKFDLPSHINGHGVLDSLKLFSCKLDVPAFKNSSLLKDLSLGRVANFDLDYLCFLEEADFDFGLESSFRSDGDFIYNLLLDLFTVTILTFCGYMLQVIPNSKETYGTEFPLNVRHLILKTALHSHEFYGITFFLNSCPLLETLSIELCPARVFPDYEPPFEFNPADFWTKNLVVYKCIRTTQYLKSGGGEGFQGNYE
ncbi:hypothetical protein CRYUN_Cryun11dG0022200 [Craigia yunnanensis]